MCKRTTFITRSLQCNPNPIIHTWYIESLSAYLPLVFGSNKGPNGAADCGAPLRTKECPHRVEKWLYEFTCTCWKRLWSDDAVYTWRHLQLTRERHCHFAVQCTHLNSFRQLVWLRHSASAVDDAASVKLLKSRLWTWNKVSTPGRCVTRHI